MEQSGPNNTLETLCVSKTTQDFNHPGEDEIRITAGGIPHTLINPPSPKIWLEPEPEDERGPACGPRLEVAVD